MRTLFALLMMIVTRACEWSMSGKIPAHYSNTFLQASLGTPQRSAPAQSYSVHSAPLIFGSNSPFYNLLTLHSYTLHHNQRLKNKNTQVKWCLSRWISVISNQVLKSSFFESNWSNFLNFSMALVIEKYRQAKWQYLRGVPSESARQVCIFQPFLCQFTEFSPFRT